MKIAVMYTMYAFHLALNIHVSEHHIIHLYKYLILFYIHSYLPKGEKGNFAH